MGCCCVVVAVPREDRGAGVGGVRFLAAVDWRGWHSVDDLEAGLSERYGSGYGLARVEVRFCFEALLVDRGIVYYQAVTCRYRYNCLFIVVRT